MLLERKQSKAEVYVHKMITGPERQLMPNQGNR